MRDDGGGYQGENAVDGKQGSGETLGSRGIQPQTDFKHITQNGNNEAEGFCIRWIPISLLLMRVAAMETITYQKTR